MTYVIIHLSSLSLSLSQCYTVALSAGNISFMDEKEITFVKKMALAIDISHEKTSGALKSVRWSDLPMDILMLVTQHLNLADHVRISITCKSWQRTAPSFLSSKSPALLFIENQSSNFFDPLSKKICVTYIPELLDATFHYSKDGWLLLSQNDNQFQFFFFNPFTNEKINLPKTNQSSLTNCGGSGKLEAVFASFSAPPTSQDCMVLLILAMTSHHPNRLPYTVHTCSHGNSNLEWSRFSRRSDVDIFEDPFGLQPTYYKNTLYFGGAFYHLNKSGTLAITGFFKNSTAKSIDLVKKPTGLRPLSKHDDCYLVESQGEILSIFCQDNQTQVFRLDRSALFRSQPVEKWIKVRSLGDKILFLGQTTSLSTVVRGKEGKIFFSAFQRGCNDPVFYSFQTKEFNGEFSSCEEHAKQIWVDPNFVFKARREEKSFNFSWLFGKAKCN
eukprot:TRINITY_DN19894_c0_g1_i2.p1 TRINITY_DN19894_c0_g1~~TRINITY_DN19894_c0_g1_i2.p1  ORF type:complete len:443 (+),score=43.77 TRINITY_DN19894_c0_g1_i2:612-1940(+)